jgi:hypothetical protein
VAAAAAARPPVRSRRCRRARSRASVAAASVSSRQRVAKPRTGGGGGRSSRDSRTCSPPRSRPPPAAECSASAAVVRGVGAATSPVQPGAGQGPLDGVLGAVRVTGQPQRLGEQQHRARAATKRRKAASSPSVMPASVRRPAAAGAAGPVAGPAPDRPCRNADYARARVGQAAARRHRPRSRRPVLRDQPVADVGRPWHHFARPGNRFWPALHLAGLTPRLSGPMRTCSC